jgi:hypothetical protein
MRQVMIWAEWLWTLALPFQLGPSKLCLVAAKKLIEFDIEYNVIKWDALNSSQAASGLWTNIGENSTLPQHKNCNVHAGVESFILCYDLGLFYTSIVIFLCLICV